MNKVLLMVSLGAFCAAATIFAASDGGVGTNDQFKGPVGLQIYSLRSISAENPEEALLLAKEYGFIEVELAGTYGKSNAEYAALLKKYGLEPIGCHFGFDRFENEPEKVAAEAKELGLKMAGVAWIPHDGDFDEADCRHAAEVFNRAGKILAAEGIGCYYHNHGYEFKPYKDGKTMFDLFMELTDPAAVTVQMDILWTIFPGQDPVALMKKYPKRFSSLHLKDLKKGVTGNDSGGTDVANDVALGTGQADYPAILKTAQEIGIEHYFIEDESPIFKTQILESLKNLEQVKW